MRTYLDCYPCVLRQALSAARMSGADEPTQQAVLNETMDLLRTVPSGASPPELAHGVHRIVRERLGRDDPYLQVKTESTHAALAMYERLTALVAAGADPLETAVRLSIAGNIIDLGVSDDVPDLWATVDRVMIEPLAVDHLAQLRAALADVDHVLYLADNAGETVFDRVLIEQLAARVTYVVKAGPVLNDATRADALAAGLDLCSLEFRDLYARAPLVIAKGQANYETLSEAGPGVYCLLQVKCPVIARDAGVPVGSLVVRQSMTTAVA